MKRFIALALFGAPLSLFAADPAPAPAKTLMPMSTTKPNIPDAACQQRLNGWVDLEFAVLPDGKVADVKVTASQPKGLFDAAAVESVSAWTYPPQEAPVKGHQRLVMSYADCRAEQLHVTESAPANTASQEICAGIASEAKKGGERIGRSDNGRKVLAGTTAQVFSAPSAECAVQGKTLGSGGRFIAYVEYQNFTLISPLKKTEADAVWVRSNALADIELPSSANAAAAEAGASLPPVSAAVTAATAATPPSAAGPGDPSADLKRAIGIGDAFLPSLSLKPAEYGLVAAQYSGGATWRLTYKSCSGKPPRADTACKGGEIFVGIDLTTGKAALQGTGE